jgi:hypothetical protein
MPAVSFYIDLLTKRAIRPVIGVSSITSAAPAPIPDFRSPGIYAVSLYFMRRNDTTTENYAYVRYQTGTPQLRLRRNRAPDFCTFQIDFYGYRSAVIDSRLTNRAIAAIIGAMPSVGKNNVEVRGNARDGFQIEFINAQAGCAQPSCTGTVVTPTTGEIAIKEVQLGGQGVNEIQSIQLREGPLATATGWTELVSGSLWGWVGNLDTTNVPPAVFDSGDLIAEVGLEASGVRTGTDLTTTNEGSGRSGIDGQTIAGPSDLAVPVFPKQDADGVCYLVSRDGATVYGRAFTQSDVGRVVEDSGAFAWIRSGTTIARVIDYKYFNAAVLSDPFEDGKTGLVSDTTTNVDITGLPTNVFKSGGANFATTDVGHPLVTSLMPVGTIIEQIIDAFSVITSNVATKAGTAQAWTVSALPSNIMGCASGAFTANDVGGRFESTAVPQGAIVTSRIDGSHITISERALNIGLGQSWTLRPKTGGFTTPTVASTQVGTLGQSEKQKITLVQQPIGGYITIRDGADASLPVVQIPAPLNPRTIEGALNAAYQNFNGITAVETVPNGEYELQFGIFGQQHLLVVDDSNAIYDNRIAQIPVGQPPDEVTLEAQQQQVNLPAVLARRSYGGLWLIGVPLNGVYLQKVSNAEYTALNDGTNGRQLRQRFLTAIGDYVIPNVGDPHPDNAAFRLDRYDNIEDRGEIRLYDWVGYKKPADRIERMQQSRPVYIVPVSFQGAHLVDMQIASVSVSTYVDVFYNYWNWQSGGDNGLARPPDGPFGTIIHFVSVGGFIGIESAFSGGGFGMPSYYNGTWHAGAGTYGARFWQSWSRRRWHSDIWEQTSFFN